MLAPRSTATASGIALPSIASILEPQEYDEVYRQTQMRGRIDSLDLDLRPWLVVLAADGYYYPQCRVSRRSPSWEHEVGIGRMPWGETDGVVFTILLVAVDTDGDFDFQSHMKRNDPLYSKSLPSDIKILDTRTVVRRDIRPGGPATDRLPPKAKS